jgi:hypothetical protein
MTSGKDGDAPQGDESLHDYAIVVGVTCYPELTRDGAVADLAGPSTDAEKVRAWLLSDEGGGVPESNLEYVVQLAPRNAVERAFARMWGRCWVGPNGMPKFPTGRRLYVYCSGHGLAASDLDHAALLCSNASEHQYSTVIPHECIRAFRQSGFFKEFVIWFDGCMDWAGSDIDGGISYRPPPVSDSPSATAAPLFEAYAAHPRFRAVEAPDDHGIVRGVFTRTLLAGIQGEAADPSTGQIDGLSLKSYLENTMEKYLPESDKRNILIDKKPLVRTDEGIVFGTLKEADIVKAKVVLRFGGLNHGAEARLWGREPKGGSVSLLKTQRIDQGNIEFELPSGLYAVDVPQHGLRRGFEVSGRIVTELSG